MENFFQPTDLAEVKTLLSTFAPAKLLAGGTDLLIEMRKGNAAPTTIIDLQKCQSLKECCETKETVLLGSMVTFSQLIELEAIHRYYPSFIESAQSMGSPQIRNRATIGGNIINGGAAADMTPVIISLDGLLVLESLSGVRTISCENYFKTNEKIRDTEVLTKIILPKKNQLTGFYKLGKRNALAIARLSLAMGLELDGTTIKSISICLGAVGKFPFRVKDFEEAAINQPVEWLSSERPLQILEEAVFQSIQGRKTMPFKKEAIKGVYKEALKRTLSRNGVGV